MKAWAWCAVLCCMAGCGSASSGGEVRAAASSSAYRDENLRLRAEAARARAAAAEGGDSPGVVKALELRAQGISARNVDDGNNIRASLRVKLERPWTASSVDESQRDEASAAELLYEAERAKTLATVCDESARGQADAGRAALSRAYRADLTKVRAWIAAWRGAGTLDPIAGARADLLAARRFLGASVAASAYRVDDGAAPLPDVNAVPVGPLDTDPSHMDGRLFEQHPAVRAHRALAKGHDHLASAETNARIPWFDFVGVDYGIDSDGLRDLAARFSIEVPIDDGASGRSARQDALKHSEEFEAQGESASLARMAQVALQSLAAFEADAPLLHELSLRANETQSLAARLLTQRTDAPDRVLQLLSEVYEGRTVVLDAQERAGRAACALTYATGVPYGKWRRMSPSSAP